MRRPRPRHQRRVRGGRRMSGVITGTDMAATKTKAPTKGLTFTHNGHRYKLDGLPVTGVTTIIGGGIPKPALVRWAPRVVAEWVTDPENRPRLDELLAGDAEAAIRELKELATRSGMKPGYAAPPSTTTPKSSTTPAKRWTCPTSLSHTWRATSNSSTNGRSPHCSQSGRLPAARTGTRASSTYSAHRRSSPMASPFRSTSRHRKVSTGRPHSRPLHTPRLSSTSTKTAPSIRCPRSAPPTSPT